MKKSTAVIISAILAVLITVSAVTIAVCVKKHRGLSAEQTLELIGKDVHSKGIDGLKDHLTPEAQEDMDSVLNWCADIPGSGLVKTGLGILNKLSNVVIGKAVKNADWQIINVEEHGNTAEARIGFSCKVLAGKIDLEMEKHKGEWKISRIDEPDIDFMKSAGNILGRVCE